MRQPGVQHLRPRDYADMQEQILTALWLIVFQQVVLAIQKVDPRTANVMQVFNAVETALEKALASGRVQYLSGVFSGDFSAQIAVEIRRLGGRFDKRIHVYFIKADLVPTWVKAAAESFRSRAKELHRVILDKLDEIEGTIEQRVAEQTIDAAKTIEHVQEGFRSAADAIGVSPVITPESKAKLAKEYSDNMRLYIEDFSKGAIAKLREAVEENAMQGYRYDRLTDVIKQRYGVTRSKAEFLARQETALFMSKYRELRFAEGGVERYRWSTAHDERVRQSHKDLDGRVFFYKQKAPAQYFSTGTPCNPGEDFNCRCVDIPVLEPVSKAYLERVAA